MQSKNKAGATNQFHLQPSPETQPKDGCRCWSDTAFSLFKSMHLSALSDILVFLWLVLSQTHSSVHVLGRD